MRTDSDTEMAVLVVRGQQGDDQAVAELVEAMQDRLWRHAFRTTNDEGAAADVLQEAWLAIVRQLPQIEVPRAFRAWAFQIVSHKARDWVRRESKRRQLLQNHWESQGSAVASPTVDPPRVANLREAVRRLPAADRTILGLRYEEEFGVAEIAAIAGLPEGTVKSRLHQIRNQLKRMMEGTDHE